VILIERLLDLSRLDAGSMPLKPRRFAARPKLEQIVAAVSDLPAGSVRLIVPDDLQLYVDVAAFEHMISNLVANALRHGQPPVTISAVQRDGQARIAIEDRGSGVPASFAPRLFDRFSRGDDAQRAGRPGAGLGLAIAHGYALAHDGQLTYQPAHPHGARFELVLPASRPIPATARRA
jgi:signal transduction histidine kinase